MTSLLTNNGAEVIAQRVDDDYLYLDIWESSGLAATARFTIAEWYDFIGKVTHEEIDNG